MSGQTKPRVRVIITRANVVGDLFGFAATTDRDVGAGRILNRLTPDSRRELKTLASKSITIARHRATTLACSATSTRSSPAPRRPPPDQPEGPDRENRHAARHRPRRR